MKATNYILLQDEKRDVSAQAAKLITDFSRGVWFPRCISCRRIVPVSLMTWVSNISSEWSPCSDACTSLFSHTSCTHGNEVIALKGLLHCISEEISEGNSSYHGTVGEEAAALKLTGHPREKMLKWSSRGDSSYNVPVIRTEIDQPCGHFPLKKSFPWNSIPRRLTTVPHTWFSWPGAYQPCCGTWSCACF